MKGIISEKVLGWFGGGFGVVLDGFSVVLGPPKNSFIFLSFTLKVPYIGQ